MKTIKLLTLLIFAQVFMLACSKGEETNNTPPPQFPYHILAYGDEDRIYVPKEGGTYKLNIKYRNPRGLGKNFPEKHLKYEDDVLYFWQFFGLDVYNQDSIDLWYKNNPNVDINKPHDRPHYAIVEFDKSNEIVKEIIIDPKKIVRDKTSDLTLFGEGYEFRIFSNIFESELLKLEIHRDPERDPLKDYAILMVKPNTLSHSLQIELENYFRIVQE